MSKIALLSTGHPPKDDRIFHKFAKSLTTAGHSVEIITSTENLRGMESKISFNCFFASEIRSLPKLKKLNSFLQAFTPDAIICSEPFALFSAFIYSLKSKKKPKLLLDITEWYPESVANKKKGLKRILSYIILYKLNILASNLANGLIIGEPLKKKRYDLIAPFRKKKIISYYPVLSFFNYSPPQNSPGFFTICFTGLMTKDRGFLRVLEITRILQGKYPQIVIRLKLIGKFLDNSMKSKYLEASDRMNISFTEWVNYESLSGELAGSDVCIDLRDTNFVYDNSLPIKIFEYLASGKPVIYSRLKSLLPLFSESSFGHLVNPHNNQEILNSLESYIREPQLLMLHSKNGRELIEKKYNWESEGKELISFINKFLKT